jgi:hypothetical protein
MEVAGANRRWRGQFRYRGSRRWSAVAQLFSLGDSEIYAPQVKTTANLFLVADAFGSRRIWLRLFPSCAEDLDLAVSGYPCFSLGCYLGMGDTPVSSKH